ncbi:MAG: type II secretion system protein N [Sphingobium sp.]|nr:type II secretion system protein N [Sphingobium sp.]
MMGLSLSPRMRWTLIGLFVVALILFFPLRLALGLAGVERMGVSARDVRGTVWSGGIDQLMLGKVAMGSVRVGLSPIQLLVGRARFDLRRKAGLADDMEGAINLGFGRYGIDDVTGAVPLGRALAPLPLGSVQMEDVSAYFAAGRCAHAEGRIRAQVAGRIAGLNLAQGLSGAASCDGEALLLSLVSQSGMEKILLRLWPSGRYTAEMRVETSDATLAQALGAAGFSSAGNAQVMTAQGSL